MAFTLVSLMLSLFGGIFAALSAFRNYTDTDIRERCNRRDIRLKELAELSKNGGDKHEALEKAYKTAQDIGDKVKRGRQWWTWAQLIPTVVFLLFALGMSLWALINWDQLTQPQGWIGWKFILVFGVLVDVGSLCCIWAAWMLLRHASDSLEAHVGTVQSLTAGIKADPPHS